jgi:transcriptional regulator with XRE-family HTH domain
LRPISGEKRRPCYQTRTAYVLTDSGKNEVQFSMSTVIPTTKQGLGELLRYWRKTRSKSQLDLSLDSGLSQRHLSFIENGRSIPSRKTLLDIARALDIPLRDRNTLFLSTGYAPAYSEGTWNAPEMRSITKALERVLGQHEPFPAVVMDRYWNVQLRNEAAPRFFDCFIALEKRPAPRNLLHLMFDPEGMRPFIANWEEVAASLIERIYRESVGRVIDQKTKELLVGLQAYPKVKTELKKTPSVSVLPFIPISFMNKRKKMNFFSMITTVGTPLSLAAQELRIESMFPADEESEEQYLKMIAAKSKAKK